MPEPLSIAGPAIGIVSFGIALCKDLVSFIGHVKDGESEKSQVSSKMDKLADCLEQLQSQVDATKRPGDNGTVVSYIDPAIEACTTALERIREKLPSPSQKTGQRNFSSYVKEWKTKLAYPFRRDELLFLKDKVESFQQNLIVALGALQMCDTPLPPLMDTAVSSKD